MVFCGSKYSATDEGEGGGEQRRLLKSMEKLDFSSKEGTFQHVRDNIDDLNGRTGIQDTDLIFLKGLMDSPVMKTIVKMQDKLEGSNGSSEPVGTGNLQLAKEIEVKCRTSRNKEALELSQLLRDPHLKAMLDAHDTVAGKAYEPPEPTPLPPTPVPSVNGVSGDAIRMVGLRKNPDEPLGVTVRIENGELVIARILGGGMIDRQGLLRVGDVIKEVNGMEVYTPEQLQEQIKKSQDNITLKIMPSFTDQTPQTQSPLPSSRKSKKNLPSTPRTLRKLVNTYNENLHVTPCYVKAMFSYDPKVDTLLPCPEIGLSFKQGDILQILNQQDPNWWQAKRLNSDLAGPAGLIPSQELEERRKAFVKPECNYSIKTTMCGTRVAKKKKKQMYQMKQNAEFDKAELVLYEEVARMPPFQRKTLVLIGAEGVGRRTLKSRLLSHDPKRFGTTIPYTSRPPREGEEDGKAYLFTSRPIMENDIGNNKYLEYGEYNDHLYGTKLDSIRSVIRSGKMCILDCNPQALKILNTPEFMPFVIFVASPGMERLKLMYDQKNNHGSRTLNVSFERSSSRQSRRARTLESLASLCEEEDLKKTMEENAKLHRAYEKFIDITVVNDDSDRTFEKLLQAVNALSIENQWVPVSWVY